MQIIGVLVTENYWGGITVFIVTIQCSLNLTLNNLKLIIFYWSFQKFKKLDALFLNIFLKPENFSICFLQSNKNLKNCLAYKPQGDQFFKYKKDSILSSDD